MIACAQSTSRMARTTTRLSQEKTSPSCRRRGTGALMISATNKPNTSSTTQKLEMMLSVANWKNASAPKARDGANQPSKQ